MDINDLKIVEDSDIQTINLDLNSPMTTNNDSLGIELLADPKKSLKIEFPVINNFGILFQII